MPTKAKAGKRQGGGPRKGAGGTGGQGDAVYGLGLIGALVYYWRRAEDGAGRARAVGKAIVWPAFVVHDLLEHLSRD